MLFCQEPLSLCRKSFPGFSHFHQLRAVIIRLGCAGERAALLRVLPVLARFFQISIPEKVMGYNPDTPQLVPRNYAVQG
jgi:hypothetical protein